jgi:hypothetical protein
MRSCSSSVLVQETAEQVASVDPGWRVAADEGHSSGWIRRLKLQSPVGAISVVVRDVHLEGPLQVPPAHDQSVQTLGANGADPPFRVGVGVGSLQRRSEHLGTLGAEHVVEPATELGVAVAKMKRTRRPRSPSASRRLRACWVIQAPSGWAGHATQVDPSGGHFDEEQHLQPLQPHRIDGEEVTCQDSGSLLAQERPPGGGRRRGVGSRP